MCWWFDFSERVDDVIIDILRWRNWGLVSCLMLPGSWEGLNCSLLPPDSPSDSLSRLSSGPCSWDLLCEGAGHSEYLPGALPMFTGALDLATHFSEGVVDAVGIGWGWVPWGLHLKCRGSLRGLLWKKKTLKFGYFVGILAKRIVCLELLDYFLWFGPFGLSSFIFIFRKFLVQMKHLLPGWDGMLQRRMEATLAFIFCLMLFGKKCLENALWQRLPRVY